MVRIKASSKEIYKEISLNGAPPRDDRVHMHFEAAEVGRVCDYLFPSLFG